ncbi:hypothetical protein [Pelagibacterium sediminicola]|uniref:hypothetical protein n=1 Tax=Pelagibacterium sediminicola TaxID=2248761 RepID=UPI000E314C0B|nr:hypothetical protein [Pelagibacterium sediminicola]
MAPEAAFAPIKTMPRPFATLGADYPQATIPHQPIRVKIDAHAAQFSTREIPTFKILTERIERNPFNSFN